MRPSRKGITLTKGIAICRPVGATPRNGPRMVPRNTPHATRTSVPKASPSCTISASGKAWKRAAYCAAICACPSKRTPRATFSMKPSGWQVAAAAAASRRFSAATCASCTRFISAGVMMPPAAARGCAPPPRKSRPAARSLGPAQPPRAPAPRWSGGAAPHGPRGRPAGGRRARAPGARAPRRSRPRPAPRPTRGGRIPRAGRGRPPGWARWAGGRGHAGPAEIALVSAEVELHEGAGWQPSRALERERDAQEARLEDRDARAEPEARAELDLVVDVAVGVHVDVLRGQGEAVLVRPAQVHRAGVDETHAQHPRLREQRLVGVALRDRRPRAGGGIEDRAGALAQDRSPGFEVELRGARAVEREVRVVAVDDGRAGGEAADGVGGDLRGRARDRGVPLRRGHPVDRRLADDGCRHGSPIARPGRRPTGPGPDLLRQLGLIPDPTVASSKLASVARRDQRAWQRSVSRQPPVAG